MKGVYRESVKKTQGELQREFKNRGSIYFHYFNNCIILHPHQDPASELIQYRMFFHYSPSLKCHIF